MFQGELNNNPPVWCNCKAYEKQIDTLKKENMDIDEANAKLLIDKINLKKENEELKSEVDSLSLEKAGFENEIERLNGLMFTDHKEA
jgi:FtsZ-binding cell division protein ZapB